ncbi:MAG: hypothetical protein K2K29_02105, partial [Muribaculaceae bacterium]|nr:hypothetical protein [Muribaculaceae bacterium]
MLKTKLLSLFALVAIAFGVKAQVVTYEPDPLYDNSENVVIYFHADRGNKQLADLPESTAIYAHCGLITAASKDDSDWKYGTEWNKNLDQYKMTYVSPNLYKLEIGNIKTFFGVKSPSEVIKDLVFVFRNANGSKEGKDTGNKNIVVPVISTALQMEFTMNPDQLTFSSENPDVAISIKANKTADVIWIAINGIEVAKAENT